MLIATFLAIRGSHFCFLSAMRNHIWARIYCLSTIQHIFNHSNHASLKLIKIYLSISIIIKISYLLKPKFFILLWVYLIRHFLKVTIGEALCDLIWSNLSIPIKVYDIKGCLQKHLINQFLFVTGSRQKVFIVERSFVIFIYLAKNFFPWLP